MFLFLKNNRWIFILYAFFLVAFDLRGTDEKTILINSTPQQTQLMEVYTSQGCSSCVPAQNWINTFVDDPRLWKKIIPVVFHVDYWDYLGWMDPFASKKFTQRQHQHKNQNHINSIYTPEFIINHQEWRGWFHGEKLFENDRLKGMLSAKIEGNQVFVSYDGDEKQLILEVAILGFGFETQVLRGENRNKKLVENFTVIHLQKLNFDHGSWQFELPAKLDHSAKKYAIALWIYSRIDGGFVQAAGGWLS